MKIAEKTSKTSKTIEVKQDNNVSSDTIYNDLLLQIDVPELMQKTMRWVDQRIIRQTDKYWRCIYIDRLFNGVIIVSSGISIGLYIMDLLDHPATIAEYIMFGLLITIFLSIMLKLVGQTRSKCIAYHSASGLYRQILCDTKKKMACDLTISEINELYQKINKQIMTIDRYDDLHM